MSFLDRLRTPELDVILAVDPGPKESGAVWTNQNKTILKVGVYDNYELLSLINDENTRSDYLVLERIACFGMAVGDPIFETCVWTGRFIQEWYADMVVNGGVYRIKRDDIKLHLCGTKRAANPHVRGALLDKLGPQGTKKAPGPTYGVSSHGWSALAVAITFIETEDRSKWEY